MTQPHHALHTHISHHHFLHRHIHHPHLHHRHFHHPHFDHGDPFYRVSRGEQLKDAGRPSHSCTGAFHHLDNDADEEGEDDEDVDDFGFVFNTEHDAK